MNPYHQLPPHHHWKTQIEVESLAAIDYDPSPKWSFDLSTARFATAGSCFAQHFARVLRENGGKYVESEIRHPLVPETAKHGYGLFSARYGNIYTTRQLRELLEQAFGVRPTVYDLVQRPDKRWIDLLRLRAIPDGFTSREEAMLDRDYHLGRVRALFDMSDVFVFTLGLTECWENREIDICYPICPGVIENAFRPEVHHFLNLDYDACLKDLRRSIELIHQANPAIRILLTVSPVMLVASFEPRGALQSSVASKAILRAVADRCVRDFDYVDYFPSFDIVTGPQARGQFYQPDLREVTPEGVALVMDVFFRQRCTNVGAARSEMAEIQKLPVFSVAEKALIKAMQVECDEILLGHMPEA
ncbi:MAG TPA: GSCFA domain-containing protein [Magnetospirillaceae bacterium]